MRLLFIDSSPPSVNDTQHSLTTPSIRYVSAKDGRRKIRIARPDSSKRDAEIFLDCASDTDGSTLTKWHDGLSMAIRAAIEAKSLADSMKVRCTNCGMRVQVDKIDAHSAMCKRKLSEKSMVFGDADEKTEEEEMSSLNTNAPSPPRLRKRRSSCLISYTGIGDDTEGALRICVEILVCLVTENVNLKTKNSHLMLHEASDAIKAVKKCPPIAMIKNEDEVARRDKFCDAALDILQLAESEEKISKAASGSGRGDDGVLRRGKYLVQGLAETSVVNQVRNGRRTIRSFVCSEDKHLCAPKEGDDGKGDIDWTVLGEYLLL